MTVDEMSFEEVKAKAYLRVIKINDDIDALDEFERKVLVLFIERPNDVPVVEDHEGFEALGWFSADDYWNYQGILRLEGPLCVWYNLAGCPKLSPWTTATRYDMYRTYDQKIEQPFSTSEIFDRDGPHVRFARLEFAVERRFSAALVKVLRLPSTEADTVVETAESELINSINAVIASVKFETQCADLYRKPLQYEETGYERETHKNIMRTTESSYAILAESIKNLKPSAHKRLYDADICSLLLHNRKIAFFDPAIARKAARLTMVELERDCKMNLSERVIRAFQKLDIALNQLPALRRLVETGAIISRQANQMDG